jgi:hypothetical protein
MSINMVDNSYPKTNIYSESIIWQSSKTTIAACLSSYHPQGSRLFLQTTFKRLQIFHNNKSVCIISCSDQPHNSQKLRKTPLFLAQSTKGSKLKITNITMKCPKIHPSLLYVNNKLKKHKQCHPNIDGRRT